MGFHLSDEELMRACQRGDASSLEELYGRHARSVYAFLRVLCGDHHDVEDLFAATFERTLARASTYVYPRPFKPWLFAIARNLARERFRRAAVREKVPEVRRPEVPDPSALAEKGEEAERALRALRAIPDDLREVVVLRVFEDMSFAEIAKVTETKEATARSRMRRALERLRGIVRPRS